MPVAERELRAGLACVLGARVRAITRQPHAYRSSCAIEDVEVTFVDGRRMRLVLKDLVAPAVKPAAPPDPGREVAAYRDVLAPAGVDVPRCYGAVAEPGRGRHWLVLEAVDGVPLWQVGEPDAWDDAARWLAALHAGGVPGGHDRLIRYDEVYLRGFLDRAVARAPEGELAAVVAGWDAVVERVSTWPRTLVHGDFYPSNLLVRRAAAGPRVVPVDWELAGVGPGLLDLAALTSGRWTTAERQRLALAYRDALPSAVRPQADDLLEALAHSRLYVAVQWLGWSPGWSPPAEHAHDWLAEARSLARELGF